MAITRLNVRFDSINVLTTDAKSLGWNSSDGGG
jgi:hypothetical protein